jgi:hypothetical protein
MQCDIQLSSIDSFEVLPEVRGLKGVPRSTANAVICKLLNGRARVKKVNVTAEPATLSTLIIISETDIGNEFVARKL